MPEDKQTKIIEQFEKRYRFREWMIILFWLILIDSVFIFYIFLKVFGIIS